MNKKRKLTLNQVKDFLLKRGLIAIEKNKKNLQNKDLKNLYYTFISGVGIILFFFTIPILVEFKKNNIDISKEIANNSKSNFEKVLDGKEIKKKPKIDEGINLKNLFDDVFKFDDLPSDTVRLSASTIEQVFKETNYNLKSVRKTKLVKPVKISL
ncbi:MAG: hypothetical protein H8E55_01310, partial [Pelagibacterales bacterium]|nr:hypothetical protein [Pelagibacterales bacterium]